MIIKGQGLMSEEEARALLDKYDIYLEKTNRELINIGMGGAAHENILFYTIDPADYYYLMNNEISNSKPKLINTLRGGNTYSFDLMRIEFKLSFPYNIVKNLGFKTSKRGIGSSAKITLRELKTSGAAIDDSFIKEIGEQIKSFAKKINEEEKVDIRNFEIIFVPNKDVLSSEKLFQEVEDLKSPLFTVKYNFKPTFDRYTKSKNTKLPDFFSNGFEKYFSADAIKDLLPKFRKFIYRRGKRKVPYNLDAQKMEPMSVDIHLHDVLLSDGERGEKKLSEFIDSASDLENSALEAINETAVPLDETVFTDIREAFLDLVGSYFRVRGFSRPLSLKQIKSRGISTPVYNMLNTAVVSGLPGYYTPTGRMRGYQFNKSVPSEIKGMENIFSGDYEEIYDYMEFGGLMPNAQLTMSTVQLLYEQRHFPSNRSEVQDRFLIKFAKSTIIGSWPESKDVETLAKYAVGKTPLEIFDEKNGIVFHADDIDYVFEKFYAPHLKNYMKNVVNDFRGDRYTWEDGNDLSRGVLGREKFIYTFFINEKTYMLERPIRFDFIFSNSIAAVGVLPLGGIEPTSIRLERAEVEYPRRREQTKKFEIDINADDDFYVEMCKVISRVLTPQDFQSGSSGYSDRNPTELSNAFLNVIGKFGKSPDHVIVVKPVLYDSLTGARRGLYLIVNEGGNSIYVSLDERTAGVGGVGAKVRGSACIGAFDISVSNVGTLYEFENEKYNFNFGPSSCVNLAMPGSDVRGGITQEQELGFNVDSLYNAYTYATTQGGKLGRKPLSEDVRSALAGGPDASSNFPILSQQQDFTNTLGRLQWGGKNNPRPEGDGFKPAYLGPESFVPLPGLTEFLRSLLEPAILDNRAKVGNLTLEFLEGVEASKWAYKRDVLLIITDYFNLLNTKLSEGRSVGMNIDFVKRFVAEHADKIYEQIIKIDLGTDYKNTDFSSKQTSDAKFANAARRGRRKRRAKFDEMQQDE